AEQRWRFHCALLDRRERGEGRGEKGEAGSACVPGDTGTCTDPRTTKVSAPTARCLASGEEGREPAMSRGPQGPPPTRRPPHPGSPLSPLPSPLSRLCTID